MFPLTRCKTGMASNELVVFARVMLAIFAGLSIWSLINTVRLFYRPLNATPAKLAAFKKRLSLSSWVILAAVATATNAIVSKQDYLLGASAILISFVLPLVVQYVRLKRALGRHPGSSNPRLESR
jgi:hypothetical protein